jgi:cobalt-zinc-cadmium efflux system protein
VEGVNREARLRLVLGLNLAMVAGLVSAGFFAHSLGVLAAAWDTVTDVAVVALSLVAVRLVRRPPTPQRTFGYHRSTILAAQANAAGILAVSILILVEGFRRLFEPHHVEGGVVVAVAAAAVVVNGVAALILRADAQDLNMRAVLIDTVGDAAANAGVAVAGGVILLTDSHYWVDPLVSILIALVVGGRALRLMAQAADVLLESTPAGLDVAALTSAMAAVDGVDSVHDLHVWSLSSEVRALSAHLVLSGHPTLEEAQVVGERLRADIGPRFGIAHTTLELECESCIDVGDGCVEKLGGRARTGRASQT